MAAAQPIYASLALLALLTTACADTHPSPTSSPRPKPTSPATPQPQPPTPAPPPAETRLSPDQGTTKAARRTIELLATLRDSVVDTRYRARTTIDADDGYYAWDCSGMAAWILRRTAPRARRAMHKSRPVARDFFRMIDRAPVDEPHRGWRRLEHVSDARPGDLFAWLRSPASQSKVTGHVGFFVDTPHPHPDYPDIYVARIVDATSLPHGNDTRDADGDGGFGFGTMLFATDADGETIGYGWHGLRSLDWGFMPARIIFGRVCR